MLLLLGGVYAGMGGYSTLDGYSVICSSVDMMTFSCYISIPPFSYIKCVECLRF